MITYRSFKRYQRKNYLYIARLKQVIQDYPLTATQLLAIQEKIRLAQAEEAEILRQYPNYA